MKIIEIKKSPEKTGDYFAVLLETWKEIQARLVGRLLVQGLT